MFFARFDKSHIMKNKSVKSGNSINVIGRQYEIFGQAMKSLFDETGEKPQKLILVPIKNSSNNRKQARVVLHYSLVLTKQQLHSNMLTIFHKKVNELYLRIDFSML